KDHAAVRPLGPAVQARQEVAKEPGLAVQVGDGNEGVIDPTGQRHEGLSNGGRGAGTGGRNGMVVRPAAAPGKRAAPFSGPPSGLRWNGGRAPRPDKGAPMRVEFYGLTFESPQVTFHLWSPWRASALEHRLFEAIRVLPRVENEDEPDEWRLHVRDSKTWKAA